MSPCLVLDDEDPTDEEINEMADWLESLSFIQLKFLKISYEALLNSTAHAEHGNVYVH